MHTTSYLLGLMPYVCSKTICYAIISDLHADFFTIPLSKIAQQEEQKLFCRHGFFDSLGVIWSFGDWAVNLLLNRKENILKEAQTFYCCHLIGSTPPPPPPPPPPPRLRPPGAKV